MGHGGMLYSLPSREVIADAVEYMVNGHAADALVCISNCDKITPGMLNAAMRLNIPTVFVSGGPMEAGKAVVVDGVAHAPTDLITAISASASPQVDDEGLDDRRALGLPDVRLVLGDVHRQLDELPHRGARPRAARQRLHARHARRPPGAVRAGGPHGHGAGHALVRATTTRRRCPARSPRARRSRTRWRSTSRWAAPPTRCCTSSPPRRRARSTSTWPRSTPSPGGCRAWPRSRRTPTTTWRTSTAPAASRRSSASCAGPGCCTSDVHTVHSPSLRGVARRVGRPRRRRRRPRPWSCSTPRRAGCAPPRRSRRRNRWSSLDTDAAGGCIRDVEHAYTRDGGLAVLRGNIAPDGAVIKTAGHRRGAVALRGPGAGRREPGGGRLGDPRQAGAARRRASSCATRAPPAGPGCRRCCTPPRSSRARASAGCAR